MQVKHLFIINPTAGKKDMTTELTEVIKRLNLTDFYEIYITSSPGDATKKAKAEAEFNNRYLYIYACGGDGTLCEVVNGVWGFPNVAVASVPIGSGNDFIKSFSEYKHADFLDLERMTKRKTKKIDAISINEYISLNIVSAGFDAAVCKSMVKYKSLPFINGKNAYNIALIDGLISHTKNHFRISVDGKEYDSGKTPHLFVIGANGNYYGGGYKAAPDSVLDDGNMTFIAIKTVSLFKFIRLIGLFRKGFHFDNPKFPFVTHFPCKEIRLYSNNPVEMNIDGEIKVLKDPVITIHPLSMNIILPA